MGDSVLFLSVSNACRGQMAEALLRRHAAGRFDVHSAGLRPAAIHPLTYRAMDELGIDLSGHRPKGVREFFRIGLSPRFAIILCEPTEPGCPRLYPGALQVLRWPFADPARAVGGEGDQLDTFRAVRDQIDRRIRQWLEEV
ncbi:MAG TPA: arsenate reductase ArsC [Isosphaeraceae bacterium]|jgi:arsenate reductase|nr:arsenate reductase ArsC [Isosphaeraceae bacterium]